MVKKIDYFPCSESMQARLEPIYETHKGWLESTQGAKTWSELPALAIKYVRRIEELLRSSVFLYYQLARKERTLSS
jgi:adenylosuccinate synthase